MRVAFLLEFSNDRRKIFVTFLPLALAALTLCALPLAAADRFITLASTTSTEQSGLFRYLLPLFTAKSGIEVRVVAQGTGQALRTAAHGDADVVLVHDKTAEEQFVAEDLGVRRYDLMYNDFILLGPASDPASVMSAASVSEALGKIASTEALFISRGDDSGTHRAELRYWRAAGLDPKTFAVGWYRETGSGMGPTLNVAVELGAYVLADRATWANFENKGGHRIVLEGDPSLRNPYGIILVNPEKHPHAKAADGRTLIDWLLSPAGQRAIADFRAGGMQVFFPVNPPSN
jgi:tungstate transport system substrate-binding protein